MKKEHEVLAWFVGLVSTDGNISSKGNSYYVQVFSIEKDWMERVKNVLLNVGIYVKLRIRERRKDKPPLYTVYIRERREFFNLIKKYPDLEQYCSPRKWRKIEEAIHVYENPKVWTKVSNKEVDFVKENCNSISDIEIAQKLNRDRTTIRTIRLKLGIHRHYPYTKWTENEEQFLVQNHNIMTDTELGKILGRTRISINHRKKRLNLTKRGHFKIPPHGSRYPEKKPSEGA